jgi:hypothetical protein
MRVFLRDILVFAILLCATYAALAAGGIRNYDSYVRGHVDKIAAAEAIDGPRILIVGDSSAAFGISAGIIESAVGVPCVNLSLHGGLDASFPLAESERILRAGDVVLLAFNWRFLAKETTGWMGALGASVLFEEPRCARSVCLRDWMRLADDGHLALGQAMQWGIESWRLRTRGRAMEVPAPYSRRWMDSRGDLFGHCDRDTRAARARRPGSGSRSKLGAYKGFPQRREELDAFCQRLEARGVRVFRASGTTLESDWESSREAIESMRAGLLGLPNLVELDLPREAVEADDAAFDNDVHMNCEARERRSTRLGERLRNAMNAPPPGGE